MAGLVVGGPKMCCYHIYWLNTMNLGVIKLNNSKTTANTYNTFRYIHAKLLFVKFPNMA